MKRALVAMVCLCLSFPLGLVAADACTFAWDAVTTYTDGTPVPSGVKYKLYFLPVGTAVAQMVTDTDQVSVTLLCPAGIYWVTAYTTTATESTKSSAVTLRQANTPVNLRWTQ